MIFDKEEAVCKFFDSPITKEQVNKEKAVDSELIRKKRKYLTKYFI